jgi:hypothetical protein
MGAAMRVAISLACVLAAFVGGGPAWGAYPEQTVRVIETSGTDPIKINDESVG